MTFRDLFGGCRPVIGVVRLLPLPGSPRYAGDLGAVRRRAVSDARAVADGGCDAVLVENALDAPFLKDRVGPETVASMTLLVSEVVDAVMVPVGVNVLRNDAVAGVAIATIAEARFVRISVHVGVMVTEQGLLEGHAAETLRFRGALGSDVAIFADVTVKSGNPLAESDVLQSAHDAYYRGLADALIVSAESSAAALDLSQVSAIRKAIPDVPMIAGSGAGVSSVPDLLKLADGLLAGPELQADSRPDAPIDPERVERLVAAARACP